MLSDFTEYSIDHLIDKGIRANDVEYIRNFFTNINDNVKKVNNPNIYKRWYETSIHNLKLTIWDFIKSIRIGDEETGKYKIQCGIIIHKEVIEELRKFIEDQDFKEIFTYFDKDNFGNTFTQCTIFNFKNPKNTKGDTISEEDFIELIKYLVDINFEYSLTNLFRTNNMSKNVLHFIMLNNDITPSGKIKLIRYIIDSVHKLNPEEAAKKYFPLFSYFKGKRIIKAIKSDIINAIMNNGETILGVILNNFYLSEKQKFNLIEYLIGHGLIETDVCGKLPGMRRVSRRGKRSVKKKYDDMIMNFYINSSMKHQKVLDKNLKLFNEIMKIRGYPYFEDTKTGTIYYTYQLTNIYYVESRKYRNKKTRRYIHFQKMWTTNEDLHDALVDYVQILLKKKGIDFKSVKIYESLIEEY